MKRWHKALILSLMAGISTAWWSDLAGAYPLSMFLLAAMLSLPLDLANEHMAWEGPCGSRR